MAGEKEGKPIFEVDQQSSRVETGVMESVSHEDYGWNRDLTPNSVIMLSLGGGIGLGLWIGTGTALASAGPAGCVIGYGLVVIAIYIEFLSIGEMTCYKPIHGGYIRQCMEYVDKAAAFAMGMNLWFGWVMTIPAEIIACISVLKYWEAPQGFPMAAYISIFIVAAVAPNFVAVRRYGHIEIVMTSLKIFAILSSMCFLFLMASGALPSTNGALVFHYWKTAGAFNNGFKGTCKAVLQAAFSCPSAGWIAVTAGEMKDPRRTVKKSAKPLFWRMFVFYFVNIWLVGMCVPYNDPGLNDSGILASPFIIAIRDGGSPIFADIINGLIFITVLGCGITSVYIASRSLTHMSDLGIIHKAFGAKDSGGRPLVSLILSALIGGGLTYLNLNSTSKQVYTWFSNLVGISAFCNWFLIYLSHIRFRQGLKAQGIDNRTMPFRSPWSPYTQLFGLLLIICFLAAQLYFAIFPFKGTPSAKNFFSSYITVPLFIIDYVLYKVWFKTKIVSPSEMDFSAAEYFDQIDKAKKEQECENSTIKPDFLSRIRRVWNALLGKPMTA